MTVSERRDLLIELGNFLITGDEHWAEIKRKATAENNWFISEFIDLSVKNIVENFLQRSQVEALIARYHVPNINAHPKKVGIVMAGNIPLVGFHDLLCVFVTGNYAHIKPSSKDEVLVEYLIRKMIEWNPNAENYFTISARIPNCEAYIATGSNNSARYFEYYFNRYPAIIRKNRTSVAILTGNETNYDLERLADDVFQYFGLGCRNVTKLYVPEHYDFVLLLDAFRKYDYLGNHHKYKNNYDYNLAIHILNGRFYMTNGSVLLVEDKNVFSPISQLHYEYYTSSDKLIEILKNNENIQCIVGNGQTDFGAAQCPGICDFADNIDTIEFLMKLNESEAEQSVKEVRRP